MLDTRSAVLLTAFATFASAQYGPPGSNGGNNNGGGNGNPYANGGNGGNNNPYEKIISHYTMMITAHAVLATLAFALLFPVGGIIIRVASFPGLWWVHGVFQMVAYILYIAAFAIGVQMATHMHKIHLAHPIIGIVLFVLLIFQPILGFLHHTMFKKYSRRVLWSYGHIWLGRIVITLGIINGGLGLQLAKRSPFGASNGAIIAYAVVAGAIWLVYVASAVFGEVKRKRSTSAKGDIMPPPQYAEAKNPDRMQYS